MRLTLLSLPDDLLVQCLSPLSQAERCAGGHTIEQGRGAAALPPPPPLAVATPALLPSAAASSAQPAAHLCGFPCRFGTVCLVNKRLKGLTFGPDLLAQVDIHISPRAARAVPRAEALLAWLQQHGRHIRRLSFRMTSSRTTAVMGVVAPSTTSAHQALAAACLVAACIVAPLEQLEVFVPQEKIRDVAWLPLLRGSLRKLDHAWDVLRIDASLQGLTALQSLAAASIACAPTADLPPALTRLSFGARFLPVPDRGIPKQVGWGGVGWGGVGWGGWVGAQRGHQSQGGTPGTHAV